MSYSTFLQKGDASEDESRKPDGRNDSHSSYYGDVESLLCNSEEPTSDSEDVLSDMLRKGDIINVLKLLLQLWRSDDIFILSVFPHRLSSMFHFFDGFI